MKTYLYFATEENGFEPDKCEINENEIRHTIKNYLADEYCQVDTQEEIANEIEKDLAEYGYASCQCEQGQGYNIIIGVARQGKCRHILNEIRALRREFLAYF